MTDSYTSASTGHGVPSSVIECGLRQQKSVYPCRPRHRTRPQYVPTDYGGNTGRTTNDPSSPAHSNHNWEHPIQKQCTNELRQCQKTHTHTHREHMHQLDWAPHSDGLSQQPCLMEELLRDAAHIDTGSTETTCCPCDREGRRSTLRWGGGRDEQFLPERCPSPCVEGEK